MIKKTLVTLAALTLFAGVCRANNVLVAEEIKAIGTAVDAVAKTGELGAIMVNPATLIDTAVKNGYDQDVQGKIRKGLKALAKEAVSAKTAEAKVAVTHKGIALGCAMQSQVAGTTTEGRAVRVKTDPVTQFLLAVSVGEANRLPSEKYKSLMAFLGKNLANPAGGIENATLNAVREYLEAQKQNIDAKTFMEQVVQACVIEA